MAQILINNERGETISLKMNKEQVILNIDNNSIIIRPVNDRI
ncbi:hypothetical protein [Latilactobacillus sakei]|nr:hypothetical protein [Latilactobacillus sakei]SOB41213.1 hypothetical protein LSAJ18_240011 [Latilactobacillus sakei]